MMYNDDVDQLMEKELVGETEVLCEKLHQCHFFYHKTHMTWLGIEHGDQQWEAGD
jgi:hypothetical protein